MEYIINKYSQRSKIVLDISKVFESAHWSRIFFYSFFSFLQIFLSLSLSLSIISRRIPLSFVAAAAAVVAAAVLALELQKKIHPVASLQE